MNENCRLALAQLNQTFYASFANDFAATRQSWPPSFDRILPHFHLAANVLDVGCGNGRLRAFLRARGWRGRYVGIDNSTGLLAEAAKVGALAAELTDTDQSVFIAVRFAQPHLAGAAGPAGPPI